MSKYNFFTMYNFAPKNDHSVKNVDKSYVVSGICNSGSRHYSYLYSYEEVVRIIPSYVSLVEYFGGGTVYIFDKNGDIISSISVFD